jgi:hypothetical protein
MTISIIFFRGLKAWGSHYHIIQVWYMTWDLLGRMLFALVHLFALRPIITAHPTCVFPSLANDTHIIDLASNVLPIFLRLQEEFNTLKLLM